MTSRLFLVLCAALLTTLAVATTAMPDDAIAGEPAAIDAERAESLSIELSYRSSEHSKDSNSQSFSIKIEGREVHYRGPVGEGERGRFKTGEVTFELDDEALADVFRWLDHKDRGEDFSEKTTTDGGSPSSQVALTVEIDDRGQRRTLAITGLTSNRQDESVLLSERAQGLAGAVGSLSWMLKRQADEARE